MPAVTRAAYLNALVDRLFAKRPHRRGTASGSGSTTTLLDADAFTTNLGLTSSLIGSWIRLETGGTVEYAIVSSTGTNLASGIIGLDRAVTSTTSSTNWWMTYEYHPVTLENYLTQVLRNIYVPGLFPLSSHILGADDNDMQGATADTITGDAVWTATSSTLTKDTTRFFPTGSQSLKIVALAANGRAELTADYRVNAGNPYCVGALCSTTSGDSAELRVVNSSSGSNTTIENATTDEQAWSDLQFQFSPPTDSETVDVWLISTTITDITYWQDFYIRDLEQKIFTTPSWLIWPSQVLGAYVWPRGNSDPSGDNGYRTLTGQLRPLNISPYPSNQRHTQELMVQIEAGIEERIYLYAMRPATALSTDSTSSYLDTDAVVENILAIMHLPPSRADQYLRVLRERTLNSNYDAPQPRAMAYYG